MISLERILCPIDLSNESDDALRYAIALAKAYEAKLYVCHCVEPSSPTNGNGHEQLTRLFELRLGAHVGAAYPALFGDEAAAVADAPVAAVKIETIVIEGDPTTAIPRAAAERRVDLIVMRSRRRPLAAALLGSTAEAICRTAPCPVLVTHPDGRVWEGLETGQVRLRRILAAYDFSIDSELALSYALLLAQEYQSELHMLHILPPPSVPAITLSPTGDQNAFHQTVRRLHHAVPNEAYLWCQVKQAVKTGPPYREILTYAEEQEIDLICLGAHGAGFAMRALFGSNADRVLRQALCPVLIARPLKPSN
jgi:nucleotide-binding universal stress UspA family protein